VDGVVSGLKRSHTEKVNPITGKSKTQGDYSVYQGTDANEDIKYVGITERDPEVRFKEHLNSGTGRVGLDYKAVGSGMTKTQARIWEQNMINKYGLPKNGGQLYNKINSISPQKWGKYGIKY
jgi:hypothetical protein